MKRLCWLFILPALAVLAGCGDFMNRTYRYGDAIPLNPFVMKVVQTDSLMLREKVNVTVSLLVTNQSTLTNQISPSRFTLRIGPSREIHDIAGIFKISDVGQKTSDNPVSRETVTFIPGESSNLLISFLVAREDLNGRLALIVDHKIRVDKKTKKQTETLSLIEIKNAAVPPAAILDGSSHTFTSTNWK